MLVLALSACFTARPTPSESVDLLSEAAVAADNKPAIIETQALPFVGKVPVYRPDPLEKTRGVILLLSGEDGWTAGMDAMAKQAATNAMVVGISLPAYRAAVEKDSPRCWYPSGELEESAQALERIYNFPKYIRPIMAGYQDGSAIAYGSVVQAPPETFSGGVGIAFCPQMQPSTRTICGHEAWRTHLDSGVLTVSVRPDLSPRADGSARFIALLGGDDKSCGVPVSDFIGQAPKATALVSLPGVTHTIAVPGLSDAARATAFDALLERSTPWETNNDADHAALAPEDIEAKLDALNLPLQIYWPSEPVATAGTTATVPAAPAVKNVEIFMSGDGGWAELDRSVATELSNRNVAVIGWDTLAYFWNEKSPDQYHRDVERVVGALPPDVHVYIGGYSFGGEVATWVLQNGQPGDAAVDRRINGLTLLGPGPFATFQISTLDWIRTGDYPNDYPLSTALKNQPRPTLCLQAADDAQSGCPQDAVQGVQTIKLPGGHHFGGDYAGVAQHMVDFMKVTAP